ncbi:hypothetical protein PTSG_03472 [Salpingoeca rosetta]|uniref:Sugar phosphate transporter domain-containing protein n=1 Tax=Salpingoeca rosetta (strain ATCC 50818 / BSB-021) TaxID=946362 RepID=F2U5A6_SALR5|nr:uncharacterized protein PTSG_03472 [Salpingoeca rosetta]EGD82822.1 hypothetical protein PTSG_03472 [Salpingoeca rosetta]|eukprot:XP_004996057.1 hypothetical protein PTSG_03472 [Salpingoeca rosetta]
MHDGDDGDDDRRRSQSEQGRGMKRKEEEILLLHDTDLKNNNPSSSHDADVQNNIPTTKQEKQTIWPAVFACTLFMILGPAVTVINKYLVRDLNFRFPVTVGTAGTLAATLLTHMIVHVRKMELPHAQTVTSEFYLWRVMPVGLFGALSICFGNAALLYLSMSFIQVLKSFAPALTLLFLWLAGLVSPTPPRIAAVLGITGFSTVAVFGEADFSAVGFAIMMLSVLTESIKMMVTQQLFSGVARFNVIESLYYIGPATSLWSLVTILAVEARPMLTHEVGQLVLNNPTPFVVAVVLGTAVNYAAFLVIKTTSTLNLKILVAIRGGAFVLLCSMLLGEHVSCMQAAGYAGALFSFLIYSLVS